jgi:hypothetical protein
MPCFVFSQRAKGTGEPLERKVEFILTKQPFEVAGVQ